MILINSMHLSSRLYLYFIFGTNMGDWTFGHFQFLSTETTTTFIFQELNLSLQYEAYASIGKISEKYHVESTKFAVNVKICNL